MDVLTKAQIRKVLDEDVCGVLGPDWPSLQEGEPRLHQQDDGTHHGQKEVVHVGHQAGQGLVISEGIKYS